VKDKNGLLRNDINCLLFLILQAVTLS